MTRLTGAALRLRYLILTLGTVAGGWWLLTYILTKVQEDYLLSVYGGYAILGWIPPYHAGPLHLYASAPQIQVGPLSLVTLGAVNRALEPGVDVGRTVIAAAVLVCGLITVWAIERTALSLGVAKRRAQLTTLLAGPVVVASFGWIAYYAHVEDAVAITLTTLAVAAVAARRPWWLPALALGAAALCKPWAVIGFPLLLALDSDRGKAFAVAVGVTVLGWGPFIIGAPGTISALASLGSVVYPHTVSEALGMAVQQKALPDARFLEMVVGFGLAALVVLRGRWQAVILAGFAGRLLLEPRWFIYYGVSALVGAVLWDVTRDRVVPVWTLWTLVAEFAVQQWAPQRVGAYANLAFVVSVIGLLVLSPRAVPREAPMPLVEQYA